MRSGRTGNAPAGTIVHLFASYGSQFYAKNECVPIFHYMSRIDRIPETAYVVKLPEDKDEQFRKKSESIKIQKTCHDGEIRCQADVMNPIDDSKEYLRPS